MEMNHRRRVTAQMLLGTALAVTGFTAQARPPPPPQVVITDPSEPQTIYTESFPVIISISFDITGYPNLASIKKLKAEDDSPQTVFDVTDNPFANNECTNLLSYAQPPVTNCTVDPDTLQSGSVSFNWTVSGPGAYTLLISALKGNDTGTDSENITLVQLVGVEYPAPPSVANKYIKAYHPNLKGKVHGCVISSIAEEHAHSEAYGPKGGPYDEGLIDSDVEAFIDQCGG